jgi:hypothetical protein
MKRFLIFFLFIGSGMFSQQLPTVAAKGFSFGLGSKFTIKMVQVDSVNFDYKITEFEPYEEIIDTDNDETLFDETGKKGTIEFYFALGTHGNSEKEKKDSMRVLLLFKNYTDYNFKYFSEIKRTKDGKYEETSNVGTYSGAIGREIWPYIIYEIGLRDFKLLQ